MSHISLFETQDFPLHALSDLYLASFGIFFVFYFIIHIVSGPVSALLFESYNTLSEVLKTEWKTRVNSNIHAVITGVGGIYVFFNNVEYYSNMDLLFVTDFFVIVLGSSTSYLLFDLIVVLWNYPKLGGPSILAHHFFVSAAQIAIIFYDKMYLFGVTACFTEVTTPFINQRWYLEKSNMKNGLAYTLNGMMIWILWFVFRIGYTVYLTFMMCHNRSILYEQAPIFLSGFLTISALMLSFLNAMWFYKITIGIIKVLKGNRGVDVKKMN